MGVTLFTGVIGLVVASLISGVFLRAAVALANKVFVPDPANLRQEFPLSQDRKTEPNFDSLVDLEPDAGPPNSNPFAGSNTPTSEFGFATSRSCR